jgi:arylsulfatase A-like enzyme
MRKLSYLLASTSAIIPLTAQTAPQRPNILFLFTDDQRAFSISGAESKDVHTPNMDRIRKHGITFPNCYIYGGNSGAVSCPSRAQLMTGKTYFQLPESMTALWSVPGKQKGMTEAITFPEILKKNGYYTFATGKQHNGPYIIERGYCQTDALFLGGMGSHYNLRLKRFTPGKGWINYNSKGVFSAEVFANATIKFLKNYKGEQPFMTYTAFTSPHDPRTAPAKYQKMYPSNKIELPANFMPIHPFAIGDMMIRDEKLAPFPRTAANTKKQIAEYYAMISAVDAQIGRILDALEKTGKADNTIIIFAADNGLSLGRHGLMGKQNAYEESINVPLAIAGPGIPKNINCDAFVYLHDLCPTICELAGAEPPKNIHGRSLLPILKDPGKKIRPVIYSCYDTYRADRARPYYIAFDKDGKWHKQKTPKGQRYEKRGHMRTIREGDWKLLINLYDGKITERLYNLKNDPLEITDLSQNPEAKSIISHLKKAMPKLMQAASDTADFSDPLRWGFKPPPGK